MFMLYDGATMLLLQQTVCLVLLANVPSGLPWWIIVVVVLVIIALVIYYFSLHWRKSTEFVLPSPDLSNLERRRRRKWREGRKERERQIPPGLILQRSIPQNLEKPITLSPDGNMLTSGAHDATIRLWDITSEREVRRLKAHTHLIHCIAWSPDGLLVSGASDSTIRLWNPQIETPLRQLQGHLGPVNALAWSLDGSWLASCSDDKTVRIWNPQTGDQLQLLTGHPRAASCLSWSPDGRYLASGGTRGTLRVWDTKTGMQVHAIQAHANGVLGVAWLPSTGRLLASAGDDAVIRLWDSQTGREVRRLEGHIGPIIGISFSHDGRLLASQSVGDGAEVRFWRTDTWELTATLPISPFRDYFPLAFQPNAAVLLTGGDHSDEVRIWNIDIDALMYDNQPSMQYSSAKVVLTGDSGVGKTGLGLVLTGNKFRPTESTHARHIWQFSNEVVPVDEAGCISPSSRIKEQRETVLWDLAGQAAYRVIHQLHLDEVTVALILFDSRSETDPFAGVLHWDRSLRQTQMIKGNAALPLRKFLVAARIDRGGVGVGHDRINSLIRERDFDGYVETSAKEGKNIDGLKLTIKESIQWEMLPRVTSTELFRHIQRFLIEWKEAGQILSTSDDLYHALLATNRVGQDSPELRRQFECCIDLVQAHALIQKLGFGNFILLQPEILDAYASALVNSVRDEPDGLGSILEDRIKLCDFNMPESERIQNREHEKLLLLAMVEELISRELALREQTGSGQYLVFPSQSVRLNPDLPNPQNKPVIFTFEGPIANIYATLAVRLSRSEQFRKKDLWKNAITYTARVGGTCGIYLDDTSEGRADLALFYDDETSEETRFHFEQYVETHLQRWAIPGSIQHRRVMVCPYCETLMPHNIVQKRLRVGLDWMNCSCCDNRIELTQLQDLCRIVPLSHIEEMDNAADRERDNQARESKIQGWRATRDYFDVFLCYNELDKPFVLALADQLLEKGVLPWLDEWEIQPGKNRQRALEDQFDRINSAAVFIGRDNVTPWQREEEGTILREFVNRGSSVIPVILPTCEKLPQLPFFLRHMQPVDFSKSQTEAVNRLIWGITGRHPFRN